MRQVSLTYKLSITFLILLWGTTFNTFSQLGVPVHNLQEDDLAALFTKAKLFLSQGRTYDALNVAEEALQKAMLREEEDTELSILELMGDIYHGSGQSANGIPYFLRAGGIHESKKDTIALIRLNNKIAEAYRSEEVHLKEMEYYEKIVPLLPEEMRRERLEVTSKIGSAAYHGKNYEKATGTFKTLLPEYKRGSETWLNITRDIVTSFDAAGLYDSALFYCLQLLPEYENTDDNLQVIKLKNNIGYYHTLLGDYETASSDYMGAIEAAKNSEIPSGNIALMHSNAAVCFTNMGQEKNAVRHFNEAINILEEEEMLMEKSRNENMLANLYHLTGDLYNAGLFSRRSIQSAADAQDPGMKAEGYLTYSNILRDGNDPVNALVFYEKYLTIRDSLEFIRRMELQALENKKNQLEKQEKTLQLRLREEEVSNLELSELRLQKEKIEKEREILLQVRNLQILKQDSLRQSIIIKDQQFLVAQQEKEKTLLEQEKQLSELRFKEEERLKETAEREKQLADQELQLANLETDRQKMAKRGLIGGVILSGMMVVLIFASLISTRRKKQLLAFQKEEIEQKNTDLEQKNREIELKNIDLEQKNEEISAQRDEIEAQRNLVFDQKQEIEAINDEIVKSIEYARRLQTAALPALLTLQEKVAEQFVLFRPRDVVSGDFYWFAEVEGKMVITVADCTGHGVPGAFMSMMGMALLKELVQKEYITHPGVILRRMRKEIINTMGQKGVTGEQRDGLDMALVTFDPAERKLDYAGAYNSLYLVREKHHPAPFLEEGQLHPDMVNGQFCLYEIPADKMPIAHYDKMDKFRNHELKLLQGDTVYLFTDGFADQFGGPKGKKFMYKPFKQLLLHISQHPLKEQHKMLEKTLVDWMGNITQVDDICIMGLRF